MQGFWAFAQDFALVMGAVFVAIAIFAAFSGAHQNNQVSSARDELYSIPGFSPGYNFISGNGKYGIAIDEHARRFAIYSGAGNWRTYSFDQLTAFDVQKDGSSVQKTNRGSQVSRAAIGGILFGGLGFVVGGLTASKRIEEKVSKLALKLFIARSPKPTEEVVFFHVAGGVGTDHFLVQPAVREMDDCRSKLLSILRSKRHAGRRARASLHRDRVHAAAVRERAASRTLGCFRSRRAGAPDRTDEEALGARQEEQGRR